MTSSFFLHDESVISKGLKNYAETPESRIVYSEIKQGSSYNKQYISGSRKELGNSDQPLSTVILGQYLL